MLRKKDITNIHIKPTSCIDPNMMKSEKVKRLVLNGIERFPSKRKLDVFREIY